MGRFGDMMSKAGEMVQQANQEYQRAKQQQQIKQQQTQALHGQQTVYGQQQYRQQYGIQHGQGQQQHQQQYQNQPYSSQHHTTLSSASTSSPWNQPHPQYNPQQSYAQPSHRLEAPPYNPSHIHHVADQALAQAKADQQAAFVQADQQLAQLQQQLATEQAIAMQQAEADRQLAEKLAAKYRREAEEEQQKAEGELRRLRIAAEEEKSRANEILRNQQLDLERQMQQLKVGEAPPVPPRPGSNAYFPPPPPPGLPLMGQDLGAMNSSSSSVGLKLGLMDSSPPLIEPYSEMTSTGSILLAQPVSMMSLQPGVVVGAARPVEAPVQSPQQYYPPPPQVEPQQHAHTSSTQIQSSSPTDPSLPQIQYQQNYYATAAPAPAPQAQPQQTNVSPAHIQTSLLAHSASSHVQPQQNYSLSASQTAQIESPLQGYTASTNMPHEQHSPQSFAAPPQKAQEQQQPCLPPPLLPQIRQCFPPIPQPSQATPSYAPPPAQASCITQQPVIPPRSRTPPPPQPHSSGVSPLAECVSDPTTYDLHWFYHPDAPLFFVCPRCYVDHIWDTQYRNILNKEYFTDEQPRRCLFGSRRMKDRLWPEAVSTRNLDPVIAFFKHAPTLGNCPQANVKENESWYTSPEISGMTMCKPCFEFNLAGTSLEKHFRLENVQGGAFCDSSTWYVKRLYADYDKNENWDAFSEGVRLRIQLPACPKQTFVKAKNRAWYKSKRGPEGLHVCVACYYDYFYGTPNQAIFEQMASGDYDIRCAMAHLNIVIPTHYSLEKKDYQALWTALEGIDKQEFCDANGVKGGTWYTLLNDPPGFGICGGCYAGIIQVLGGTKFFVLKNGVSEDDKLLCCFNLNHCRAGKYLGFYSESLMKGTWKPLGDYAVKFGTVPPCQRSKVIKSAGRKFWGWGVAAICEECYLTFAQGTALEDRFFLKGEPDVEGKSRMCDLFSLRMRDLYTTACQTGDLEGFLAYGEQRHQVWVETIAVCEQILTQQKLAAMQANMLGIQGSFYKNMGGMVDATQGHSYTVGNAYAGYGHANEWALQGHVYDRQSAEVSASVTNPGNWARVGMLEQRWKNVE